MNRPEQNTTNSQESRNGKEKFKLRSLKALSGVGIAVLAACNTPVAQGGENTPPAPAETTTTQEQEKIPIETNFDVETISAELPADQLIDAALNRQNDWVFQGATSETVPDNQAQVDNLYLNDPSYNEDYDAVLRAVADANGQKYAETVFKTDWQNDPALVDYYNDKVAANAETMNTNIARFKRGEAYVEQVSQIGAVVELEAEENQRIVKFDVQDTLINSNNVPVTSTGTYTFDISDGTARIAAVSYDIQN